MEPDDQITDLYAYADIACLWSTILGGEVSSQHVIKCLAAAALHKNDTRELSLLADDLYADISKNTPDLNSDRCI